jgi:uroporphyrinogen decarboxylase
MTNIQNDRLLRALKGETVDRPPVWLMRQAGRYLPEYLATRERAGSFMGLCQTPELACEVTLQPIERFGFDAAILFSDILTIPDAMGLGLYFTEGEGPQFQRPIRTLAAIQQLPIPDPEQDLRYVMDAVRLIKKSLANKIPLIGFAGSPWTLASYMIEGKSSRDFITSKALLYAQPEAVQLLLDKLSETVSLYLRAQIEAGADVVMIFDSWGGVLPEDAFLRYALPSIQKIVAEIKKYAPHIPVIGFTKGGGLWLDKIKDLAIDGIGIDWTISLAQAREAVGDTKCLQGNLDPTILFTNPRVVQEEVKKILQQNPLGTNHIFNLGHGILPRTPIENVEALVATVRGE